MYPQAREDGKFRWRRKETNACVIRKKNRSLFSRIVLGTTRRERIENRNSICTGVESESPFLPMFLEPNAKKIGIWSGRRNKVARIIRFLSPSLVDSREGRRKTRETRPIKEIEFPISSGYNVYRSPSISLLVNLRSRLRYLV